MSLSNKIISKRCELVQLCHMNRMDPVFETQYQCIIEGFFSQV